jgi:hypothetical protein
MQQPRVLPRLQGCWLQTADTANVADTFDSAVVWPADALKRQHGEYPATVVHLTVGERFERLGKLCAPASPCNRLGSLYMYFLRV